MSWSFSIDPQESARTLIKVAEKYEQDVDMDTVMEKAKQDANLYITNPEHQKHLVEMFDSTVVDAATKHASLNEIVREAFNQFETALLEAAKAQKAKSMPHLKTILDKYPSATEAFNTMYDEVFVETLRGEVRDKWLKTRPMEYWAKNDSKIAEPGAKPEIKPAGNI